MHPVELKRLHAAGKPPKDDKWKSRYREPTPPKNDALSRIPRDWATASIDQLGWTSGYGTSVKCTYEAKGPAVLRIPNVRNRKLDFEDLKFATGPKDISQEDFIAPGDLLLIRTNGSKELIGRAAVARTAPKQKCSFASYLIRFRLVGDETLWSWASLTWGSDMLRTEIQSRAATTAGQYNVSLSGLANLALPLPPLAEQSEIVGEVERRLSAADRLAATINRQLELARVTCQSLLRQAFAGKLVAQDPTDEPASILLDRIRAAREADAKKPKAKRMPKSKSKPVRRPLLEVLREYKRPMTPELLFKVSGYQHDFDENECRQEIVDQFYEELRSLVGPHGPVQEKRPNRNTVQLELR